MLYILYIILYTMLFYYIIFTVPWKGDTQAPRFDLFFYLPMNRMFITIGAEFSQFQSTGRIVSIFFSNISGNACWFLINTVSYTTSAFQKNPYSGIFTLGHEPPLFFFYSFKFSIFDPKKVRKKMEVANSKSNYVMIWKISL